MFPFLKKKTLPPKIPVDKLDPDAVRVIRNLNKAGFEAYVVGGGVRDILLGMQPKDFDIATDARPRQTSRALGRNAMIIGKRFKIVIFTIPEKEKKIEIATFRKAPEYGGAGASAPSNRNGQDSRAPGAFYQTEDNEWGTIEDDVFRRDFTANAIYYDYSKDQIVDFVGGVADISRKILRSIGDPNIRFREDPVRMIRAVRLAAKLGFTIEKSAAKAIAAHAAEINLSSKPRLFDELLKIFKDNCSEDAFRLAWSTDLLKHLLPGVASFISDSGGKNSVFWDFLAAFDTYKKANPGDEVLASNNAASLIPFATLLAPIYLAKNGKSRKREHLANDLVSQNLVAQFSNKLFSQPQAIFRNIAFYLATLPDYKINANVSRRDRKECLAIGRVFWEICAAALGDSKALMFIKNREDNTEEEEIFSFRNNSAESEQPPNPTIRPDAPRNSSPDARSDEESGIDSLNFEAKRAKGEPPLVKFVNILAEPQLEPVLRKLCESGELENILPETHDRLKSGVSPLPALLAALDKLRKNRNLEKKSWRLVLPVAVIAAPEFATGSAAILSAPSPDNPDAPSAILPGALESIANNAVSAIFAPITRDKYIYSTIRKRASQVLQSLYLPQIPQAWMSDTEMFRAIREIYAESVPGYTPPQSDTPSPRRHSRRRRNAGQKDDAASKNDAETRKED